MTQSLRGKFAKDTIYREYEFRSRLEARWAVFFDIMDIDWEYELEGYQLDRTSYLPDFLLYNMGRQGKKQHYVEVKSPAHTDELDKPSLFASKLDESVLLAIGKPDYKSYELITGDSRNLETVDVVIKAPNDAYRENRFWYMPGETVDKSYFVRLNCEDYINAVCAATRIRFERHPDYSDAVSKANEIEEERKRVAR